MYFQVRLLRVLEVPVLNLVNVDVILIKYMYIYFQVPVLVVVHAHVLSSTRYHVQLLYMQ